MERLNFTTIILGLGLVIFSLQAQAQTFDTPPFKIWDETIGGTDSERFSKILELPGEGYIFGGSSQSDISGDRSQLSRGSYDYWLVKTDYDGNTIWDRSFGGNFEDFLGDMYLLDNGDILLLGGSRSEQSGDKSENMAGIWMLRINQDGEIIWDKTIQTPSWNNIVNSVLSSQGGLFLTTFESESYTLIHLNLDGEIVWQKQYSKSAQTILTELIELANGNILLGGYQDFPLSLTSSTSYWVVQFDSQGDQLWENTYGGENRDLLFSMAACSNGDILLGGESNSNTSGDKTENRRGDQVNFDFWILKIDQDGNLLWDKTLGGNDNDGLRKIIALEDGGAILGGFSISDKSFEKSENAGDREDYWIIRVDNQGNKIWDDTFIAHNFERFEDMILTQEGAILIGGQSDSFQDRDKSQDRVGGSDFWVIKLEENDQNLPLDVVLVNAETDQDILTIQDGAVLSAEDLEDIPLTFRIGSRPLDFGSVNFDLQGPLSFTKSENQPPYTLFGKNSPEDFLGQSLPIGEYTLTVTAYSQDKKGGTEGQARQFSFTIGNETPPSIEQFILVNADTEEDIQVLKDGDQIVLDNNDTRRFSIRAEPLGDRVKSVELELTSDQLNHTQTENLAPFALFGGEPASNYFGKTFPNGTYSIKATPYLGTNLSGLKGQTAEVNFTLVENVIQKIFLVDASNGQDVGTLRDNMVLECNDDFSVRVETGSKVESLQFILKRDGTEIINRVENLQPFTLLGEDLSGKLNALKTPQGNYDLILEAYAEDNASGEALGSVSLNFFVRGEFKINAFNIVDASSGQQITQKDTMTVPPGGFSMIAEADPCVDRVRFVVNNNNIGEDVIFRNEYSLPYTLNGETASGELIPWYPQVSGDYIFEVYTYSSEEPNQDFENVYKFRIYIEVPENAGNEQNPTFTMYPNPIAEDDVHLHFNQELNSAAQILVRNKQGQVIFTQNIASQDVDINTSSLAPGLYFIEIQQDSGIAREILIKH